MNQTTAVSFRILPSQLFITPTAPMNRLNTNSVHINELKKHFNVKSNSWHIAYVATAKTKANMHAGTKLTVALLIKNFPLFDNSPSLHNVRSLLRTDCRIPMRVTCPTNLTRQ